MQWILFLLLSLFTASAFAAEDPWYKTAPSCGIDRGNPARTGEYNVAPLEKLHGVVWSSGYHGTIAGSIENIIFCGDNVWFIGGFSAFKPFTIESIQDRNIWNNAVWHTEDANSFSKTSSFYNGILYTVPDMHSGIKGYDGKTGKLVFDLKTDLATIQSILLYNNIIYFDTPKSVVAYDLKTKKKLWLLATNQDRSGLGINMGPLSTDGKNLYVPDVSDNLYAIDLISGNVLWKKEEHHYYASSSDIIPYDNKAFVSIKGIVYALSTETGKTIWTLNVKDNNIATLFNDTSPKAVVNPEVNIGTMILGISDHLIITYISTKYGSFIAAFDTSTGNLVWKKPFYSYISNTAIAGNIFYFVDSKYDMYAIDIHSGKTFWTYHIERHVNDGRPGNEIIIVPTQKKLIIGGRGGELFLLY